MVLKLSLPAELTTTEPPEISVSMLPRVTATIASLGEVLSDPIYAREDEYVGPVGLSWIYRAAPLSPDDPWDDIAEAALDERFRWR